MKDIFKRLGSDFLSTIVFLVIFLAKPCPLYLALWVAIIFASRATAFF